MGDSNRRKTGRLPVEVKVDYRTVGSFITDYTKDLSQGGIFVATSLPLEVGERVRLRLTLPGHALPFALEGVVRWTSGVHDKDRTPGMGIEFVNFSDELREELSRLVDKISESAPND
jgi:type IV pilus assembly protein PilZ